ncbi:ABC transporter permease [Ruminococcus sp.]|uniref:ABC transporter permease n=1 Tax=Ruminococcus sp. TaxID=41978 RepID=UPI0025E03566|nr:ABC transporter permease [Ruminococcus sp.]
MKFYNLFRKELKEMLSLQTIMTMVISVIVLVAAGQAMSGAMSENSETAADITICDKDNTEFTKNVISALKATVKEQGGEVRLVEINSDNYSEELKKLDENSVVIIPQGFTDQVTANEKAKVQFVQRMTSLAAMSNLNTGSATALAVIEQAVKSTIYQTIDISADQITQLEDPIELDETTVIGNKSDNVSSSMLLSLCSAQSMVVPIIMFVLIMFSSQMILSAISTEKIDKTLETLLSAPVSRLSVLTSKMLAAGVVAALQAIVYMFGMSKMTGSLTAGISADTSVYENAMQNLGLTMNIGQYVLVGIQMFLSILIALSISLVLGALAKDAKSAQTLLLPITLAAMIPYMLSMVVDIKTVSPVLRYLVYAIPFTHTFMASENVMFGNYPLYLGGLIYQLILLVICMTIALKVFMSDRIFTMSIGGKKQRKAGFSFGKKQ